MKFIVWVVVDGVRMCGVPVDPPAFEYDQLGFEVEQVPWDSEEGRADFSGREVIWRARVVAHPSHATPADEVVLPITAA